jgi:hypothetical protein
MAAIPKANALLAVCKALNPFFNFDLVRESGNELKPVNGVKDVRIGDALKQLHFHDQRFGLHVIDFIFRTIVDDCRAAGYVLTFGPAQLVNDPVPVTVGDLAIIVRNGSRRADT